ncbi:dihydrofolate reductase [Streptococcus sp. S784/96/1]|uniref:dihydrofolate reductase n=1 Tax=Streptococcus sp. S784/96/1 TaxID=2653499 RepID=UPI001389FD30|nr:dihydrofolate reductase [Streptococcus sp. S784/96/1]
MTNEKKMIAIWAQTEDGIIGKNQTMPWYLPAELNHFKETTIGQAILMGRVTFDGMNRRKLPGRETLILTRDTNYSVEGVTVVHSIEEVLNWFEQQEKTLYIAGGSAIYKAFEAYYDGLIKTTIHADIDGDAYFPSLDMKPFVQISERNIQKDDKNPYDFTISIFDKKEGD